MKSRKRPLAHANNNGTGANLKKKRCVTFYDRMTQDIAKIDSIADGWKKHTTLKAARRLTRDTVGKYWEAQLHFKDLAKRATEYATFAEQALELQHRLDALRNYNCRRARDLILTDTAVEQLCGWLDQIYLRTYEHRPAASRDDDSAYWCVQIQLNQSAFKTQKQLTHAILDTVPAFSSDIAGTIASMISPKTWYLESNSDPDAPLLAWEDSQTRHRDDINKGDEDVFVNELCSEKHFEELCDALGLTYVPTRVFCQVLLYLLDFDIIEMQHVVAANTDLPDSYRLDDEEIESYLSDHV